MIINAHQVPGLRREAEQLAKSQPEIYRTVAEAKDVIARREGYSTWQVLLRQAQSPLTQHA